jgi:predicted phage terminase large subunit-like protein
MVQQLLTRALPNNVQLMIGTRFAEDDIHARLLENQQGLWRHVNIPALSVARGAEDPLGRTKLGLSHWPEYFPTSALREIRAANERNFQCLYQGVPTSAESGLFGAKDFTMGPAPDKFILKFGAIDTATSKDQQADESVLTIFGVDKAGRLAILDVIHGKYDFAELTAMVKHQVDYNQCRILLIENANVGKALGQAIKKDLGGSTKVEYVGATKDKFSRASQILSSFRSTDVYWADHIADLGAIQKQFTEFPFAKNDDIVDSVIYGVLYWQNNFKKRSRDQESLAPSGEPREFFRKQSR